jgi:hypothetical protein
MMEEQALCRVHRMGQKKGVKTIRYRIQDSFEEVSSLLNHIPRQKYTCLFLMQKVVIIQERKKDLAALTMSNGGVSEADLDSARLQVSRNSILLNP